MAKKVNPEMIKRALMEILCDAFDGDSNARLLTQWYGPNGEQPVSFKLDYEQLILTAEINGQSHRVVVNLEPV